MRVQVSLLLVLFNAPVTKIPVNPVSLLKDCLGKNGITGQLEGLILRLAEPCAL